MKFNCGLSEAEKALASSFKAQEKARALNQWHPHFAWWPTRVGSGDCRWLEWVERRCTSYTHRGYISNRWGVNVVATEYRAISGGA